MAFNWLQKLLPIERKTALNDAALLELFGLSTNTSAGVVVTVESALRVPAVACAVRVLSEAVATLPAHVARHDDPEPDDPPPAHALLTDSWNESISACAGRW